ncbi:hypothetical protein [Sphingobium sp. CCH11-B1]|uniref:hypothetical protein n=1 Tax=Sphingobium sp. CCH11-B1 TaxID=1768781 RepID=UPI00082D5713|nr:hypothetical protein [Sphingobium sp. CCH11-B1]MEA3387971.1 hypothetical protein [Pseudomonadota bacterium]
MSDVLPDATPERSALAHSLAEMCAYDIAGMILDERATAEKVQGEHRVPTFDPYDDGVPF